MCFEKNDELNKKSKTQGSLLIELMIAICISSLYIISSIALVSGSRSIGVIASAKREDATLVSALFETLRSGGEISASSSLRINKSWYGNDTMLFSSATTSGVSSVSASMISSDLWNAIGSSSCFPLFHSSSLSSSKNYGKMPTYELDWIHSSFGSSNYPTDIQVRHGVAYVTADSAVQARDDVFVFDMKGVTLGSLHTGPGAEAVAVASHYLYIANTSATNQLQVIDIADRAHPFVAGRLKLPLPYATSTSPKARSVFYTSGRIYLGTEKWDGMEFAVIDVSYPPSPMYLGGFEVGSVVNNIVVRNGIAYLAVADGGQLIEIDVSDPLNIRKVNSFSPDGGQIEVGNRIIFHHDFIWFGRSGGGFNTASYKELYRLGLSESVISPIMHAPGGIRGIVAMDPYIFVAIGSSMSSGVSGGEIVVWNYLSNQLVGTIPLYLVPIAMTCDESDLYVVLEQDGGIIRVHF